MGHARLEDLNRAHPTAMHPHGKSPASDLHRLGPAVSLGFFTIGTLSLGAVLAVLLLHPEALGGGLTRPEGLALLGLFTLGFVGSFLFGSACVLSPLMSASSLASGRLALAHLILHGAGLLWLAVVFGGLGVIAAPGSALLGGLALVCAGAAVHIANLYATASRFDRWEPAHVAVLVAQFWLALGSLAGVALLARRWIPGGESWDLASLAGSAHSLLLGVVWLSLVGLALELHQVFLPTARRAGGLSWTGLAIAQTALLLDAPLRMLPGETGPRFVAAAVALGSLLLGADLVRLRWRAPRTQDAALLGVTLGIVAGIALLIRALAVGGPKGASTTAGLLPADPLMLTGLVAVATVTLVPCAFRLVPFVIWRLRCTPRTSPGITPAPSALRRPGHVLAALICLWAAAAYLVTAQATGEPLGTRIAAICLAVGLVWFVGALGPAISLFVLGPPDAPDSGTSPGQAPLPDAR